LAIFGLFTKPSNIQQKLTFLRNSKFRSKFSPKQKDREYIATKGLETIKEHAYHFINTRIASADPKNDGKQTQGFYSEEQGNLSEIITKLNRN